MLWTFSFQKLLERWSKNSVIDENYSKKASWLHPFPFFGPSLKIRSQWILFLMNCSTALTAMAAVQARIIFQQKQHFSKPNLKNWKAIEFFLFLTVQCCCKETKDLHCFTKYLRFKVTFQMTFFKAQYRSWNLHLDSKLDFLLFIEGKIICFYVWSTAHHESIQIHSITSKALQASYQEL